eukprot:g17088.t1
MKDQIDANIGKFLDPKVTAKGETRATVTLTGIRTLWINTGTLCNIACSHCYIESSPTNDALAYLSADEARAALDDVARAGHPVTEIGFTGGEPFLNPQFPQMIEDALARGHDVLILTNAMKPMMRPAPQEALLRLNAAYPGKLTLRISLDHYAAPAHDAERGAGSFEVSLQGMRWLRDNGFAMAVAGRGFTDEPEDAVRAGYAALFQTEGFDIDAANPGKCDNYDGKDREPSVLPVRFPNMLVNGAGGIAVGMATNIPPHNLGEVVDATLALIENPDMSVEDLIEYVPGPDFPTGGVLLGRSGARKAYIEGRGSCIVRAKTHVEELRKERYGIVVDEIPYQVNKSAMIEKIAEQVRDKKIEGIAHVQDESDRHGVRVVIELKRDATPDVVLNQLWRFTPMQTYFGCNMLALNGGRPEVLTLYGFLSNFITFREEVVARRTAFLLRKARERSHILCGLAVAVSNVDEVVATIRSSADAAEAREKLMTRRWPAADIADYIRLIDDPAHTMNDDGTYNLSETQARAILELRLQRLTQLGVKEVTDELEELAAKIKEYLAILGSRDRIMGIISDELREVKELFAVPRRTEIVDWSGDMDDEDLIEREDMVVTITQSGWIKRTPLADYRSQKRGGKGLSGMSTKDDDVITSLFVANTHTQLSR